LSTAEPLPVRILEGHIPYRDGSEERILEVLTAASDRSSDSDELAAAITDWPSRYHLSRQRASLLRPLRLGPGLRILEIGAGTGVLSRYLAETGAQVVALEGSVERARAAATIARMACERAKERNPSDDWVRPTLIGMAFDSGDVVAAEELYDQLLQEGPAAWKLETTLADVEVSVSQAKDAEVRAGLQAVLDKLKALVR